MAMTSHAKTMRPQGQGRMVYKKVVSVECLLVKCTATSSMMLHVYRTVHVSHFMYTCAGSLAEWWHCDLDHESCSTSGWVNSVMGDHLGCAKFLICN